MRRRAILIESSRILGHVDLRGARSDVRNYKEWLTSSGEGAWNEEEVHILSHPTKDRLEVALHAASSCDYVFVTFSGHGRHVVRGMEEDTMIQINDSQEFSALRLNQRFTRATIAVDSCRAVDVEPLVEAHDATIAKALMSEDSLSRSRHRTLFDENVEAAERGTIFLFSCSRGEAANEGANGGAFSFGLVQAGRAWWTRGRSRSTFTILTAFEEAVGFVKGRDEQQSPAIEGSVRRLRHFPFAVRA